MKSIALESAAIINNDTYVITTIMGARHSVQFTQLTISVRDIECHTVSRFRNAYRPCARTIHSICIEFKFVLVLQYCTHIAAIHDSSSLWIYWTDRILEFH